MADAVWEVEPCLRVRAGIVDAGARGAYVTEEQRDDARWRRCSIMDATADLENAEASTTHGSVAVGEGLSRPGHRRADQAAGVRRHYVAEPIPQDTS